MRELKEALFGRERELEKGVHRRGGSGRGKTRESSKEREPEGASKRESCSREEIQEKRFFFDEGERERPRGAEREGERRTRDPSD